MEQSSGIPEVIPGYGSGESVTGRAPNLLRAGQPNEYMLVIQPPEALRNRILEVKRKIQDELSLEGQSRMKPYIALLRFTQLESMEEKIIARLKRTAMGMPPFPLEISGFGSFPSHSIYLKISQDPLRYLLKEIKPYQDLMKFDKENKPHFISEPFLMIANRMQPWQYEKGWQQYRHKHFTGRFIAGSMLLLSRRQGALAYRIVGNYHFENLPVQTMQGELFG